MKYGLSEKQLTEIHDILASYSEVEEAIIYGSRVLDTYKEASDVDIAIKGKKADWSLSAKIKYHLEEETYLPFFFDITAYNTLESDELKKHINTQGKMIYRKRWQEVKLGDVVEISSSKRIFYKEYVKSGIPFYRSKEIIEKHNKQKISTDLFITESKFNELKKQFGVPTAGDLLITSVGTLGIPYIVKLNEEFYFKDGNLIWLKNFNKKLLSDFLYYWILSPTGNRYIQGVTIGSTQPALTIQGLKDLAFLLPSLPEQKAITEILSSLDDKIDLLNRQNKTLEDMAQTLFRKWFIEDADEKWEKKSLDEIANYLNGLACQKYPPKNDVDKLPVLKIRELINGINDNSDWVSNEVDTKYIVELGDIIFSWSGSLVLKIWDGEKCILNQHLFKVTSEKYPKWFFYFWTKHYLEKFVSIAKSKATTMGHIKKEDISSSIVLIPSNSKIENISKTMDAIFGKIVVNLKEIHSLKTMRDLFLPKLISGKITIG